MDIKIDIPAISELADAIHVLSSALYESRKLQVKNVTQEETATTVEEAEEAKPEDLTVTLEEIRAKLAALTQGGKQAEVKALIKKYGGAKLSDIPKDKYPQLMQEAEAM